MATIKDVAKLASVSVATVSRVINNHTAVSVDSKKSVLAAIEQLNYTPNYLGKNLRQQHTKKVIVVLNSISNQFYSRVLKGIETKAKEDGYTILICCTRNSKETILEHLELLQTKVVDGAIFMAPELASGEILQLSGQYPIICACEPLKGGGKLQRFVLMTQRQAMRQWSS